MFDNSKVQRSKFGEIEWKAAISRPLTRLPGNAYQQRQKLPVSFDLTVALQHLDAGQVWGTPSAASRFRWRPPPHHSGTEGPRGRPTARVAGPHLGPHPSGIGQTQTLRSARNGPSTCWGPEPPGLSTGIPETEPRDPLGPHPVASVPHRAQPGCAASSRCTPSSAAPSGRPRRCSPTAVCCTSVGRPCRLPPCCSLWVGGGGLGLPGRSGESRNGGVLQCVGFCGFLQCDRMIRLYS